MWFTKAIFMYLEISYLKISSSMILLKQNIKSATTLYVTLVSGEILEL